MNLDIGGSVGDYQVVGILGAGGMGKVYKVRNVISDRIEAMKVLLPDLEHEPDLADRFIREIKVQASLEHPNIATLHTALRVENQLLMLMEYVEGDTLDHLIKDGPLPVSEAVEYIVQVLAALGYAHEHGVIHRDIKPANMMLTHQGVVKLMDFGIAKAASDRKLTMTGTTMGSLYYMSPEQIKGATTLDARSDLYSLGVTLYELVTGKRPFDGDSQFAIMAAHLEKAPVPPVSLDARLPAALNDIILLSVGKEPEQRFQTAAAFRNALLSVQAEIGGPAAAFGAAAASELPTVPINLPNAPAPPPPAPPPPARGGHRGLWLAAGALFTALAVVAVIQFGPWRKASAGSAAPPAASQNAITQAPAPAPAPATPSDAAPVVPAQSVPAPLEPAPAHPAAGVKTGQPATAQPKRASTPAQTQVSQAPPPAQAPAQAPQQQAQAPVLDAAPQAALQQVRENLVMLGSRATAAHSGLQNLQRSQGASGMGLRGDMVEANTLMKNYLDGANAALNAGDAAAARSLMDKAERQLDRLEKFLGR